MNLQLNSKRVLARQYLLLAGLLAGTILFWCAVGTAWSTWNYPLLDLFYQQAVRYGFGPPSSSRVVELAITDETYAYFDKHILDRADLSQVNDVLMSYRPEAVAYDMIFARPSRPEADQRLATSIREPGPVYLPIGVDLNPRERPFVWQQGRAYERLRSEFLATPGEHGSGQPLYASRALLQTDLLSDAAFHTGHIGVSADSDGVYRHFPLLVKLDSQYIPALALSMFLHHIQVPFDAVQVHWGQHLYIPATAESFLEHDLIIPIDQQGRVFIPHPNIWQQAFAKITAHALLQHHQTSDLQGNLADFFEGRFVFVGDISTGVSDLGQTPLESHVPLLSLHSALLSALLNHTFYTKWSFWPVMGIICLINIGLAPILIFRSPSFLYLSILLLFITILVLTGVEFIKLSLFPFYTVFSSFFFISAVIFIDKSITNYREQNFIRNAFSKYIPESVVNELILHPDRLTLRGEERILSVLFSDLEGFTSVSERLPPTDLIRLLNEYLTEMTHIILSHGGIIDKFEGDAIMAEFGMPLELPDHPVAAVRAGLAMQRRLHQLRQQWVARGLPALRCRIGINTGRMIIGNMGSDQVFDYTAMGDPVNLASRLESVNKRYGTYLMISEFTYAQLPPDLFDTRLVDVVRVQGKSEAVNIYEVYGDTENPMSTEVLAYYKSYETAFTAYLGRDFATAQTCFAEALSQRPCDVASQLMLARLVDLDPHDLPEDWDGAVTLTSK